VKALLIQPSSRAEPSDKIHLLEPLALEALNDSKNKSLILVFLNVYGIIKHRFAH
jgi:hypothetical protein